MILKELRQRSVIMAVVVLVALSSCGDWFDTHPYDVHFDGETYINGKQMKTIEERFADKDTLRIAFISDTHGWYTDMKDEIAALNQRTDIDFVIHCGDLTDTGTAKEYVWARDILSQLHCPYVALIGNHDFLGTGDQTYQVMYGKMDFSFIASHVKFVCLNTNATEYDYMAAVPNFDFMEEETTANAERFSRSVLVMHAPPYSDQFNNNVCKAFRRYLDFFPGLMCCVYGHNHNDQVDDLYNDGLLFYAIDSASHRNYRIMTITPDNYEMEQVFY